MNRTLTLRDLNRATLSRQLLLERADLSSHDALSQLLALQAQRANSPFIALWSRLTNFEHDDLANLIQSREVVKGTLMRATLHLMTVTDYAAFRPTLQAVLDNAAASILKQRKAEINEDKILNLVRDFLKDEPHTFADITKMLEAAEPDTDIGAMRYTARMKLPMLQLPVEKKRWSYPGRPQFTLADDYLDKTLSTENHIPELIRRYLRAFAPASVADIQRWTGFGGLSEIIDTMRDNLTVYHDENGRELFDLPDMPLPAADTPAPPRFLPEFDNVLLAYDKRERVLDDAYRKKVYSPGLRVHSVFLLDGFVAGGWKIEKKRGTATLNLDPFITIQKSDRAALSEEGEKLLHFIEPKAKAYDIQFEGSVNSSAITPNPPSVD